MIAGLKRRAPARVPAALIAALVAVAVAAGGCTGGDGRFPATSTCPSEPRAAGTLPELEALLPTSLGGVAPTPVDSGWNCLSSSLGSYARHAVTRLEFAGATWDEGEGNAAVAAIFRTPASDPALQPAWVEEYYEIGARTGRTIDNVETRDVDMPGAGTVWRLDALNSLSLQTIVAWPVGGRHVRVVIVSTEVGPGVSRDNHDRRVDAVVAAAAAAPAPSE